LKARRNLPVLAVANPMPNVGATLAEEPSLPPEFDSPGLSLLQIYSILRAYRLQALIIAVVISLIAAVTVHFLPKTYIAVTTLMVDPDGTDPLANAGTQNQSVSVFNYMATEAQLMVSPEVLLPVIDQLQLTKDPTYTAGFNGDANGLREHVREVLAKNIEIRQGEFTSQLIAIDASARTSQLAAQLANTLADVYLTQQRRRVTGPASERAKRYTVELAELKDKVRIAQDQVTAFRQRTGVTDTSEKNISVEQQLLGILQGKLQDAQVARRTAEVKAMAQANDSNASTSLVVLNLKELLNTQQTQLAQMRTTFGAQHPKVRELQSQIDATQSNLDRELSNVSNNSNAELVAARQLEAKLRVAVEEQRAKVLGVNKLEDEGMKYELELESAQSVYKRALDGYDEIMFATGGRTANISVVSSAIPPQQPAKPKTVKLLAAGIAAGILLGLIAPLCYELLLNRRVRCRDDFERGFDVPVLIEFDRIITARVAT